MTTTRPSDTEKLPIIWLAPPEALLPSNHMTKIQPVPLTATVTLTTLILLTVVILHHRKAKDTNTPLANRNLPTAPVTPPPPPPPPHTSLPPPTHPPQPSNSEPSLPPPPPPPLPSCSPTQVSTLYHTHLFASRHPSFYRSSAPSPTIPSSNYSRSVYSVSSDAATVDGKDCTRKMDELLANTAQSSKYSVPSE